VSEQSIDLMLIPLSYSTPDRLTKDVSEKDIERMNNNWRAIAPYYFRLLGIPAVSISECGLARADAWEKVIQFFKQSIPEKSIL
jgi:hypothetical protein